jgi:hypothetical protein
VSTGAAIDTELLTVTDAAASGEFGAGTVQVLALMGSPRSGVRRNVLTVRRRSSPSIGETHTV